MSFHPPIHSPPPPPILLVPQPPACIHFPLIHTFHLCLLPTLTYLASFSLFLLFLPSLYLLFRLLSLVTSSSFSFSSSFPLSSVSSSLTLSCYLLLLLPSSSTYSLHTNLHFPPSLLTPSTRAIHSLHSIPHQLHAFPSQPA